jgi:hypothetical protein
MLEFCFIKVPRKIEFSTILIAVFLTKVQHVLKISWRRKYLVIVGLTFQNQVHLTMTCKNFSYFNLKDFQQDFIQVRFGF